MTDEDLYKEWIASRQSAKPSRELTDRVMSALESRSERRDVRRRVDVPLADRINQSPLTRWAACVVALLVGILPFLYVAYFAYVADSPLL